MNVTGSSRYGFLALGMVAFGEPPARFRLRSLLYLKDG